MKNHTWKLLGLTFLLLNPSPFAQAVELESVFVPYGFINASYWAADHSVGSVGALNSNFSAPVASGLDRGSSDNSNQRNRSAFEVQQSRFGFNVLPKQKVRGKFEVDFFNGSNASPSTASVIRLRIAKVEVDVSPTTIVSIGQDWDMFNSGVNPNTHNWVGNYYQGGNVGFLRQQLTVLNRDEHSELGAALGMAQNSSTNAGAFPTSNSQSDFSVPSMSVKAAYVEGKNKYGVTALYAPRISAATVAGLDSENSHTAFGTQLFSDLTFSSLIVHARLYWGQNLKDVGALGLSSVTTGTALENAHDTHEIGGFVSGYLPVSQFWVVYGGAGYAKIPEDNLLPTDGLIRNWQVKLGGEYLIADTKAKVFWELTRYASEYKVVTGPTDFIAYTSQLGIEMGF